MRALLFLLPPVLLTLGCTPEPDPDDPPESPGPLDQDGDGVLAEDDCDDDDASVYPGAVEVCDGLDNDCDGVVDPSSSEDAATWFADMDGDGFGDAAVSVRACDAPEAHVGDDTDCDDTTDAVHPGQDEFCDGLDNDCDDVVDPTTSLDAPSWFPDGDGDGFGDDASGTASCAPIEGWIGIGGDCDDADAAVRPDAAEICDGIDNDCSARTPEARMVSWVPAEGGAPVDVTRDYALAFEDFSDRDYVPPTHGGGTLQFCRGHYAVSLTDAGGVDVIRGMTGDAADVVLDGRGQGPVLGPVLGDLSVSDLTIQDGDGSRTPMLAEAGWTRTSAGGVTCQGTPRRLSELTLRNVVLRNNSAAFRGGAVSLLGCALDAEDVVFEHNTAGEDGGAIHAGILTGDQEDAPVRIAGGTFTDNIATEGDGGAIWSIRMTVDLEDVTISGGSADRLGGAIAVQQAEVLTLDTTLEGNVAGSDGGAIHLGSSSAATLTDSVVVDNTSGGNGGGVYGPPFVPIVLDGTRVDRNTAAARGGGIFVRGDFTCDGSTRSAGFHGNTTGDEDFQGALLWLGESLTMTDCDFGEAGTDDDNAPEDLSLVFEPEAELGDGVTCSVTCERQGVGCVKTGPDCP